jgi:hypothetical protein
VDAPELLVPRRRVNDPAERRRRAADSKAKQRTRRRLFQYFLDNGFADDDELAFFLDEFLQLQYPREASCPHHIPPFQILSDLYFDRVRAMLIYASRASGKTLTFAVMNLLDGSFRPEAIDITNAAATRDQAVKCYRYFTGFHKDPLLAGLLAKDPTQSYSEYKTGSTVEVVTGSIKGLNSRHPAKSRIDEIELVTYETLKEGLSMSQSKGSVPATDMFASTRKWGGGTMTRLLNEADTRGIAVRPYCVWEVAQRCERQCRDDPVYGDCPIYTRTEIQLDGTIAEVPFCYGRLHDVPGGWLPVDDVIQKGMLLDKETWEVQWENKKPTAMKRVLTKFHQDLHTMTWAQFRELTGFERPPAEWTRVAGLDLGSVFAYGLAAIDPLDRWWWIGEFYDEGQLSTKQRGYTLRNRRLYWDGLLVIADPAQKQERQGLLIEANVVTVPAIKDVMLGINQVRKKLELGPDNLPMMIMISDEMAHMVEPFKDDPHVRPDATRPDRVPRPLLPLCFQERGQ